MRDKWDDLQTRLRKMPGKKYLIIKRKTALRYLTDYSKIIQWYAGSSFFNNSFLLKNRVRKKTDDVTGDNGKIPKKKMKKFNTEIRNILGSTVLRQLNTGHSQLVDWLNRGYAQLQAKEEEEEVNEKEREETGKVTTVVKDVLVIGIGNYYSVTKSNV